MDQSSKRFWLWLLTSVVVAVAGIWVYELILANHRGRLVNLFSRIEIGHTRANVDDIFRPLAATSGIKRSQIDSREKYFIWGGDDWILILDYTNNVVEFAGIVSSDQLGRRPKRAPPWKQGAFARPRLQ